MMLCKSPFGGKGPRPKGGSLTLKAAVIATEAPSGRKLTIRKRLLRRKRGGKLTTRVDGLLPNPGKPPSGDSMMPVYYREPTEDSNGAFTIYFDTLAQNKCFAVRNIAGYAMFLRTYVPGALLKLVPVSKGTSGNLYNAVQKVTDE